MGIVPDVEDPAEPSDVVGVLLPMLDEPADLFGALVLPLDEPELL